MVHLVRCHDFVLDTNIEEINSISGLLTVTDKEVLDAKLGGLVPSNTKSL